MKKGTPLPGNFVESAVKRVRINSEIRTVLAAIWPWAFSFEAFELGAERAGQAELSLASWRALALHALPSCFNSASRHLLYFVLRTALEAACQSQNRRAEILGSLLVVLQEDEQLPPTSWAYATRQFSAATSLMYLFVPMSPQLAVQSEREGPTGPPAPCPVLQPHDYRSIRKPSLQLLKVTPPPSLLTLSIHRPAHSNSFSVPVEA